MDQEKESTSGSSSGAVLTRAQSLRQRFADSRNADSRNSSSATLYSTVRWPQHQEAQASLSAVDASATAASASSNSKSPSPSRKTDNHSRRPSPKSWTNAGGAMTPPSLRSPRRPATPTAVACDRPGGAPSGLKDHSDDLQVGPYLKGNNLLDRRGMLATFKSKSLDLLGSSRISARLAAAAAAAAGSSSSSGTAVTTDSTAAAARNADRRRRVFRRHKKANSATGSYEDSAGSQSRSSSIESNQSSCGGGGTQQSCGHAIHRGLESALKASTLFAWSSVEHASTLQHQVMPASQPSFIEMLEDQLKSGPEMTRIEHLSDLHYPDADPPCHFCSNQSSLSIHDSNRLKIVSGGRVRGRDGSRESINPPYINLPSPNVQEDVQYTISYKESGGPGGLFPGGAPSSGGCSHHGLHSSGGGRMKGQQQEEEQPEPPASVLTRRRALVPPKIPPYNVDSCEDASELTSSVDKETSTSCAESGSGGLTVSGGGSGTGGSCGSLGSAGSGSRGVGAQQRRSSFVVIPPMQICPGDLLVYSKVLTQRNSVLDWEGSTQSLACDPDGGSSSNNTARKQHKNSWSLLKLFDRSGRTKSESLSGLEEVLTCMQPSTFYDDQLSRYRGLCWADFLAMVQQQKLPGKATKSTLTSTTEESVTSPSEPLPPAAPPVPTPTAPRNVLVRQATQQDYSSRIKEWTQEKRARFGLVRTMSERCLDRKILMPELKADALPSHPRPSAAVAEEEDEGGQEQQQGPSLEAFQLPQPAGPKSEQRRKEALWDLFQSECAFLYDHIMVLKNVYMDPLKKIQVEGYAMFAEPELLFGNLDELCCVTYSFCKEFISLLLLHAQPPGGGDTRTTHILTKLFQKSSKAHVLSQAYHRYALNYINALNYLETLRRHMEFCEFEKWCNRDPRCKKLQLTDLLVAPVQHIMKVPLLLREVEARTEEPAEKEAILKILEKEEASLRELDDKMKWLKNFERLLEIQRSLVWPSVLDMEPKVVVPEFLKNPLAKQPCERLIVSPRRQIVLEGPLSLLDTGRPSDMHVILFDDMLLITRKKKGLGKKKSSLSENWGAPCSRSCLPPSDFNAGWRYIVYKQPLSLDRFFLHEINSQEATAAKLDNGFVIISLNRFQQIIGVHTFQASSEQVKHTWLLKIRETQERWKRTLQTTVFRAQRTLSNSPSSSVQPQCPAVLQQPPVPVPSSSAATAAAAKS